LKEEKEIKTMIHMLLKDPIIFSIY
jgi:hypothetical protein